MTESEKIQMEYEQVNENIRSLADIRFRLLAMVPPLGGVAIFVLSRMAAPEPGAGGSQFALVGLVAVLGFLATLGITFYDQRNSELYNALGGRANFLEYAAKLEKNPDLDRQSGSGQFLERPPPNRRLFGVQTLLMKHDRGLALIYGPVLGAWFFPIVYSGLGGLSSVGLLKSTDPFRSALALGVAGVMVIVFTYYLLKLDDAFSESRLGTVDSYDESTRTLRLKYTIRGQEKELDGKLRKRLRIRLEDYQENCELAEGNTKDIPEGARVKVRYKDPLLSGQPKEIVEIRCVEKVKKLVVEQGNQLPEGASVPEAAKS